MVVVLSDADVDLNGHGARGKSCSVSRCTDPIAKDWHDMPWWESIVIRLVAGEQDPLSFFFVQPVRDEAVAPSEAIVPPAITLKSLPPTLKGAQADADLAAGADQARTRGMSRADQLDRLAPVSGAAAPFCAP